MPQALEKIVTCYRCGHRWTEDLARRAKKIGTIYKGEQKLRSETYELQCPNCGIVNMLDVTFEETRDA